VEPRVALCATKKESGVFFRARKKRMGRPRKAEAAIKKNWNVRFSEDDREMVLHNARLLRMTPSAYIRQCATQGTVRIVRESGHDPEKVRALLAIGNNLNQIARQLNAGGAVSPLLSEVLGTVRALLTEAGRVHGPQD
jgi:hypothetical protein